MLELVRRHPRRGYRMVCGRLRLEGWLVNHKRIYRLWRREGLCVPRKHRKRRRLGNSLSHCTDHPAPAALLNVTSFAAD